MALRDLLRLGQVFFLYIRIMSIMKLLYCLCFIALLGCASSEPVKQQDSNADDVRARAAQAYSELDAEQ
jgi:hypothetical protein